VKPPRSTRALPPADGHATGCTSIHFGENQLSPCSIGISPLPTAHPILLQQKSVRPFTPCYRRCSLAMGGSHGFRSTVSDNRAVHTRFPSGSGFHCLNRATDGNSSGHSPKGTRSPLFQKEPPALTAWTRSVSGSISLPSPGCFSPFPHGTVRYRSRPVSSLGSWSTQLPTQFHELRGTRAWGAPVTHMDDGTITRYGVAFQPLCACDVVWCGVLTGTPLPAHNPIVATPVSLTRRWFRRLPFRSPLLREWYLFLGLLRCFSSPGALPREWVPEDKLRRVAPLGNDGLTA